MLISGIVPELGGQQRNGAGNGIQNHIVGAIGLNNIVAGGISHIPSLALTALQLVTGLQLESLVGLPGAILLLGHGKVGIPAGAIDLTDHGEGVLHFVGHGEHGLDGSLVVFQSLLQTGLIGGVLDVGADDLGDVPPGAVDLALNGGVLVLLVQNGQCLVGLNSLVLLRFQVGGTPRLSLERSNWQSLLVRY